MNNLIEIYGSSIVIENCTFGVNLNLGVIRGFARLDLLAAISAPDVFDQEKNPQGTQRELNKKHAKEATEYAMSSLGILAEVEPRAFTEVILNARDLSAVTVLKSDSETELEVSSLNVSEGLEGQVTVKINLENLTFPHSTTNPQISRVDGNHRLSHVELPSDGNFDDYPYVPFALFIGLSTDQERAIFRDINGTQMKMETAHLDTIKLKLQGAELLKTDSGRALWVAQHLSQEGWAFEGKVFFGGSTRGARALHGSVPPIKISTLKTAVETTLREMSSVDIQLASSEVDEEGNTVTFHTEQDMTKIAALIDRYWKAVAKAYPTAWNDRTGFILLQSIGLTSFSRLAAEVITRQFVEEGKVGQEEFDKVLEHIASEVDLSRENYPGLAGLAGAREVHKKLTKALNSGALQITAAKRQLEKDLNLTVSPLDQWHS